MTPLKKTILVADDERRWREDGKSKLSDKYHVEFVNDCESVVPRIERGGIDLLVLDLLMPGTEPLGDGFDVCRHLSEHFPKLPIIVYTGAYEGVKPVDRAKIEALTKAPVVFKDEIRDPKLDDLRGRVDSLLV